jgi:maltooligosyltrehalose trehalohydrolase
MGQEWACSAPFRFFSDHKPELGRQVTEGRRREFKHFSAFSDPETREKIPDPQAPETFEACRLDWQESGRPPHRGVWQLYRRLLELRKSEPALGSGENGSFEARAAGESALVLERRGPAGQRLTLVCQLRGGGSIELPPRKREIVLTTEEAQYCTDPVPPATGENCVEFRRPGAVLLRHESQEG